MGALAGLLALSIPPASAQVVSDFSAGVDPVFQGVLNRPSDLTNTLKYAAGAPATDVESAISTYEQLLFYNPKLSRIRFELGVLYFRLGSYEMARSYFQSALQMADLTPELRAKIDELLPVVDKKLQPDQFSGYAQTGLRYQTNAASGPGQQAIVAGGKAFNPAFVASPDGNWFGGFGLNYVHDFMDQNSNTFEASFLGYDAQQFRLTQFNLGLLEIRTGPRFGLTPDSQGGVSIKPYALATGAMLGNSPYFGGLGGGVTMRGHVGNVAFEPYVEFQRQSFKNSVFYPLASGLSGTLSTYALQVGAPIYAGLGIQSRVAYTHDSAQFSPFSYNGFVGDVWLPWNFTFPGDGRTWTLTPTGGVSFWQYAAPDPNIAAFTTPRILEWRVGLGLDVPIWKMLMFGALLQYRADQSNVSVFSMRDFSVMGGPEIKF